MAIASPRRPLWIALAGLAGWLTFAGIGMAVDVDDPAAWEKWTKVAADAAAAVGFAAFAGGGLVGYWERRTWRARTQWIVYHLTRTATREVAILASTIRAAGRASLTLSLTEGPQWSSDLFELPLTERKKSEATTEADWLDLHHLAVISRKARVDEIAADEAARTALEMADPILLEHVDTMWSSAGELAEYLKTDPGAKMLTAAGNLRAEVLNIADPYPGTRVPMASRRVVAGISFGLALKACVDLAGSLDDVYRDLANGAQGALRQRIDGDLAMAKRMDDVARQNNEIEVRSTAERTRPAIEDPSDNAGDD